MDLYWTVLAMIVSTFLGYRVALENRLSGVTGVLFGLGISSLVATELWRYGLEGLFRSGILVSLVGAATAALAAVVMLQKFKLLAYAKLIGWLVPFSMATIGVPRASLSWEPLGVRQAPAIVVETALPVNSQSASSFATSPPAADEDTHRAVLKENSPLYRKINRTFVKTTIILRKGSTVELGEETTGALGGRWFKVTFTRRDRSFEGYLPGSVLQIENP